jgi:hypothetical protein
LYPKLNTTGLDDTQFGVRYYRFLGSFFCSLLPLVAFFFVVLNIRATVSFSDTRTRKLFVITSDKEVRFTNVEEVCVKGEAEENKLCDNRKYSGV